MRQNTGPRETAEKHVRDIRRATRRKHSAEDKIRIVLSGLRGEYSETTKGPAEEKQASRSAETIADICDEHLAANKGRIKTSTWNMDQSRIEQHIKPLLKHSDEPESLY